MPKPISVLMIAPRYGTVRRGVEVFVRELVRHMDKQCFQVTILSGLHGLLEEGVEAVEKPLLARERLETWAWPLLRNLPGRWQLRPAEIEALSLMFASREFLQARSFDVILPIGGTWTYRFAHRYCHGARIVSVGQGGPVRSDLELSDFFVALTPTDEAAALKMRPEVVTRVIPNGVDTERFRMVDTLPLRGKSNPTILCVAALFPDKRHDLLFAAALLLDASVRIVCAGKGPLKSTLMQHPLYKEGRVDFVEKEYDEMHALYQAVDAFTLASPDEAFGIVFLEALACGLPVVACDAARQRYVVGETGFFCDVRNPTAYANALESALSAPADQNRRHHAEQFGWPAVTDQYQELFFELCSERPVIHE